MKLSLIIPSFYPATVYGGPIFSTLHACEALSKINNFTVYVSSTNTNYTNKLNVSPNKWIRFNDSFFVKYYNETIIGKLSLPLIFKVWIDIKKADVVHLQGIFSTPTPASLFYAKLLGKPILLSPRGSFCKWCIKHGSRYKKLWVRLFIMPFSESICWHATSQIEKDDILRLFPSAKVYLIPNGIDTESFKSFNSYSSTEYLKKFAKSNFKASHIIISMGRLHKVKGFDILIIAFKEILKTRPCSVLLIAGSDEGEQERLSDLVKANNLTKQVFLIGEISNQNKVDFLANADLFVLPSHTENFGNVYLESLASGTPIVASKNTPWASVEEENCGRWVNNTVNDTADAILDMLKQDKEAMKKHSQKMAHKYSWNAITHKFKKSFQEMINERI